MLDKIKGVVGKIKGSRKGRKRVNEVIGYVLYKQSGKKRVEVHRFDSFPDENMMLEEGIINSPGRYFLQEIRADGSLGRVVWSREYRYEDEVEDEDSIDEEVIEDTSHRYGKRKRRRKSSSNGDLLEAIEQLEVMAEQFAKYEKLFKRLSGKVDLEDALDTLAEYKEKFDKIADVFGYNRGKGEIPVEGAVPAWAIYVPEAIDRVLDKVEKRVNKLVGAGDEEDVKIREFPR